MKILTLGYAIGVGLSAVGQPATAQQECDFAQVTNVRDLSEALSERAVQIVSRVQAPGWHQDRYLDAWVDPNVKSRLGSGDISGSPAEGLEGVHSLVTEMRPISYRYDAWGGIPRLIDGCTEHKVEIEFIEADGAAKSTVLFTFFGGRLTEAMGWRGSVRSGLLPEVELLSRPDSR